MIENYNPDVLTCLANLSNDEVFTPPNIANQMLDLLPAEIWRDKNATFLDPATKSGVFLREIAKRLMEGLKDEIPNQQKRIDHIFTKQIFGIAITDMTALLTRRSLYCSKKANGKYSICEGFDTPEGNILFGRVIHEWEGERCKYCGANINEYDRDESLETHAYQFIHTDTPEELFNMKFDVIVGNPPYQLETGGSGRQATPIYQEFVSQAKKLNPRFLTMIIPSRWFAGGMGLDDFRKTMLEDKHVRSVVDYANAKDCFPQNSISGGVCYFLWDRDNPGLCNFTNIVGGKTSTLERDLSEFPVMIRYNESIGIIRKVLSSESLSSIASSLTPFGLPTNFRGSTKKKTASDLLVQTSVGISYIPRKEVDKGLEYIGKYKVLMSKTGAEHAGEPDKDGKYRVLTKSMRVMEQDEICTHSYFVIGIFDSKKEAENLLSYIKTKFVRFLVLLSMSSINVSKSVFQFVPLQDFGESWSDDKLYKKYKLTKDEIEFIDKMIRPMGEEDNG